MYYSVYCKRLVELSSGYTRKSSSSLTSLAHLRCPFQQIKGKVLSGSGVARNWNGEYSYIFCFASLRYFEIDYFEGM